MPLIRVLCSGNPLRRDDGAAWAVAGEVRARLGPAVAGPGAVEVTTAHQLLPEHAEWVARSDVVLFVDAALPRSGRSVPWWRRVAAAGGPPPACSITHFLTPEGLVAWALLLYGRMPREAYRVCVPAFDLGHGEGLSSGTGAAARVAAAQVVAFVRRRTSAGARIPPSAGRR